MSEHYENWTTEMAQLRDSGWGRWVANAERILGHTLDGDQRTDGYSLDAARDAFEANVTSAEYAARVRAARPGISSILTDYVNSLYA